MEQNFKWMVCDLVKHYDKFDDLANELNVGTNTVKSWLTSENPKPTGPHIQAVSHVWDRLYRSAPDKMHPGPSLSVPKRKLWLPTGKFRESENKLITFEDVIEEPYLWATGG